MSAASFTRTARVDTSCSSTGCASSSSYRGLADARAPGAPFRCPTCGLHYFALDEAVDCCDRPFHEGRRLEPHPGGRNATT